MERSCCGFRQACPTTSLVERFKDTARFSKVLVFSGWVMVPRMIATLLSYEVERQTVGDPPLANREKLRRANISPTE